MFSWPQNCCLRYTVGIRCHFFPVHLLPETLTLWEVRGTFPQETWAPGFNPEGAGENLKVSEHIFTLQAEQKVRGFRWKACRHSKQGINQNKTGNMERWQMTGWLALSHTVLQQSFRIFVNPVIYTDTSNCVMQAHKVKPGYHHRHLASCETGLCFVRQL